ncbi:hydroxyethylthiazole kinase [Butyrivibrio sp. INlla14]|uniref:hydroxyethylthiazole kinase n=1 Tax=Butyrivibrio sp. INlla14 TaxID=1520808 RepID=UPI00087735B9|nr:hydroxyethylthiazole kinase [Butyrivibrio sp. INlla14]SCY18911.1 hydroxyethylthiazole kinase [Butyrivibrio sp. INlla14]
MSDLIHCITNPIAMNLSANVVLALDAKPIMAEHPDEVKEITKTASALLLNLGNISDTRMEAMKRALSVAMEKDIPVVIDAVGASCSELRRRFFFELNTFIDNCRKMSLEQDTEDLKLLIKGNYSEIKSLFDETYRGKGVDAQEDIDFSSVTEISMKLSEKLNAAILATGKRDVMSFAGKLLINDSGHPMMSLVTGTGCALGASCARFLAKEQSLSAVARACILYGIAGEKAYDKVLEKGRRVGTGSFQVAFLDELQFLYEDGQKDEEF